MRLGDPADGNRESRELRERSRMIRGDLRIRVIRGRPFPITLEHGSSLNRGPSPGGSPPIMGFIELSSTLSGWTGQLTITVSMSHSSI